MKNRRKKKYIEAALRQLKPLTKIPAGMRRDMIPLLSDECIHRICESCQNLVLNTYNFDESQLKKIKSVLRGSEKQMRLISKPSSSLLSKRKILSNDQTGRGVFTLLASAIVPALVAALTKWQLKAFSILQTHIQAFSPAIAEEVLSPTLTKMSWVIWTIPMNKMWK